MEEFTQITLDEWVQWKEDIREKLKETAGNFVHIGYRLKQIRDSGMLDGAADIFEFAQREYGLGKSTVSRFIAINEKFSEGGNSLELKKEYQNIGSSKLAEMLTLPDAECMMITEKTTVKDIRELKNFIRQQDSVEQEETEEEWEERKLTPLQKCLEDYFRGKKEMLNRVVKAIYEDDWKEAAELMNPSGAGTHKKGICFLFMYDFNTGVKAKLLTSPQPIAMSWRDVLLDVYDIYGTLFERGDEDVYTAYYGEEKVEEKAPEEEPKKEPEKAGKTQKNTVVATSQQKVEKPVKSEKKTEQEEHKYEQKKESERVEEEAAGASGPEIEYSEPQDTEEEHDTEFTEESGDCFENDSDLHGNAESTGDGANVYPVKSWRMEAGERMRTWEDMLRERGEMLKRMAGYDSIQVKHNMVPLAELEEMYQHAINVAAALERLLFDKRESEGLKNE